MSAIPVNKALSDRDWEFHKDTIKSLYLTNNLKLKGPDGLMAHMSRDYAFSASEAQYERRLRKWQFYKNRSRGDWKTLGKKIAKRKAAGKASDIYMNNKLVSMARVRKEIARHTSPSTFGNNVQACSPRTPEGIIIQTPEAEDVTLFLPTWTNDLPFFWLETCLLPPPVHGAMGSARYTELQEFIDPRVLHIFASNAPGSLSENPWVPTRLLRDLQPHIFKLGRVYPENFLDSEQIVSMIKASLPSSVLDSHLARQSSLTQHNEGMKSIFLRLMIFLAANNCVHRDNLPMKMTEYLKSLIDIGLIQSLLQSRGPEFEALAENLFRAAIESEDSDLIKFLLQSTDLDCNKLFCIIGGRRYTPVERASQLRNIEVTRHLIAAQADVNKTFEDNSDIDDIEYFTTYRECCGALQLAIQGLKGHRPHVPVDIKLVRMLLHAGAEVYPSTFQLAIDQTYLDLVKVLIFSLVETSRDDWIQNGALDIAILRFDSQSAMEIIMSMIELGAGIAPDISPDCSEGLQCALEVAAARGHLEVVRYLLRYGACLTQDSLSSAVGSGNKELLRFLLHSNVYPIADKLSLAVTIGDKELVESFLDAGADVDGILGSGVPLLAEAIRSGNSQIVKLLACKGAWSRITEMSRFVPTLEAASGAGDIKIVRDLLSCGAKFNSIDLYTPLRAAVYAENNAIAKMLLDGGADPNNCASSLDSKPLLIIALRKKNRNLVRLILEADAEVTGISGRCRFLPILDAVDWGDHAVVGALIARGANINLSKAVTTAVEKRDIRMVQILVNAGADVNYHPNGFLDKTALHAAANNKDIKMTEYLLANGADPNDSKALLAAMLYDKSLFKKLLEEFTKKYQKCPGRNKRFGLSALATSILREDLQLMDELLETRVDPNAFINDMPIFTKEKRTADKHLLGNWTIHLLDPEVEAWTQNNWPKYAKNMTPLGLAIVKDQSKNMRVIQKILDGGGDPNSIVHRETSSSRRNTALLAAIGTKRLPIVKFLINAGAKVNCPATSGVKRTPLQHAAEIGCFDIVQTLLNEKASVNAEPAVRGGGTALQFAAIGGYIGIAELLLKWGADPNAPASKVNGRNALEGAAEHGRIDMLKFLFNVGAKMEPQLFERSCRLAEDNGYFATKKYLELLYFQSFLA